MTLVHTLIGSYVIQSVLHAFIALVIVELSFYVWEIRSHLSIFRFRMLTLALPAFMFPFYQLFFPERGSWHFRLNTALFDSQRWLDIRMLDMYPFALFLLLMLFAVSAVFIIQEILPIFRSRVSGEDYRACEGYDERMDPLLDAICAAAGTEKPSFVVIDESFPVLFMQGVRNHTIIISNHVMDSLDDEQLSGALTHEIVHMMRGSSFRTQLIYLLRMIMFYNPVSLIEFRRIVHDEEFICDGITVGLTGKPAALIKALRAFYFHPEEQPDMMSQMRERIESHSHNLILDERIANIENINDNNSRGAGWLQFLMTSSAILITGYLVV
ncbi:MAG: M48 family metalloprotease [Nitrospirae bacterium]|nr:M48 family metalloprotease [Nitrospirota bacterium]